MTQKNNKTLETPFQYSIKFPKKVYAGQGSIANLAEIVAEEQSQHILLLTDPGIQQHGVLDGIVQLLDSTSVSYTMLASVPPEPTEEQAKALCKAAGEIPCDLLVAVGGGSVLDVAKIIALALTNPDYPKDFQSPDTMKNPPVPMVALPTTAGTGSESTANSILLYLEQDLKIGIISDKFMYPYVILDPLLTATLPPALTASTGIDALCHAVESYISTLSNPLNEVFALEAARLISQNIVLAFQDGENLEARAKLQLGAFYAGVCLTSSSTVAVHALSYPLGGKYLIPHGVSNAILLPHVMEETLPFIRREFTVLAEYMLPDYDSIPVEKRPEAVLEYLYTLTDVLAIPKDLSDYHVAPEDLDYLTENAMKVTRLLSRNPKPFGVEEIQRVYNKIL